MTLSEILTAAKPYVWNGLPGQKHGCHRDATHTYVCNALVKAFRYGKITAQDRVLGMAFITARLEGYSTFTGWQANRQGHPFSSVFQQQQMRLQWLDNLVAECQQKEAQHETQRNP